MGRLYLAYGSNLSRARMAERCPQAVPLRALLVPGWRLGFERVATIIRDDSAVLPAALYRLTAACERTLDRIEGVSEGRYRRHMLPLPPESEADPRAEVMALTYIKIDARRGPPLPVYLAHIADGYRDWSHDPALLDQALRSVADLPTSPDGAPSPGPPRGATRDRASHAGDGHHG